MAVRTYYEHKRVKDTWVPYSFQCESCGKDINNLNAHIIGQEATRSSNFRELNDAQAKQLEERAHQYLVSEVKEAYKDATEKNIYSTAFVDECPYCHKSQSWGVSGLKKKRFDTPIVIFGVGIVLFVIFLIAHYLSDSTDIPLPIAFGVLGAGFVGAIISLIWNTIKISMKMKETSANGVRNVPNIDWSKVQELLNEAK